MSSKKNDHNIIVDNAVSEDVRLSQLGNHLSSNNILLKLSNDMAQSIKPVTELSLEVDNHSKGDSESQHLKIIASLLTILEIFFMFMIGHF